ncbi:Protein of unknown function [Gryllus bimaculatus]|nr:Protein of unknown function [Gryllus bimaculatus]
MTTAKVQIAFDWRGQIPLKIQVSPGEVIVSVESDMEYNVVSIPSPEKLWSNCDSSGSDDILKTLPAPTSAHIGE